MFGGGVKYAAILVGGTPYIWGGTHHGMGGYSGLPSQTPKKREHSEKFSALRAKMISIFRVCEVLGGTHPTDKWGGTTY